MEILTWCLIISTFVNMALTLYSMHCRKEDREIYKQDRELKMIDLETMKRDKLLLREGTEEICQLRRDLRDLDTKYINLLTEYRSLEGKMKEENRNGIA